jgi:hypothetical protein
MRVSIAGRPQTPFQMEETNENEIGMKSLFSKIYSPIVKFEVYN